jgi:hypothetical protein
MNKFLGSLKSLLVIIIPIFIIHFLLFEFSIFTEYQTEFYYSIPFLYLLFFICTTICLFIIVRVSQKNFDSTGMSFMLATIIQTILAFLIVRPILNSNASTSIEKANYFFIFFLFLAVETIISIRILNKKS